MAVDIQVEWSGLAVYWLVARTCFSKGEARTSVEPSLPAVTETPGALPDP